MTVRTTADIHFNAADVHHKWHPEAEHGAYGVLKFAWAANLYFHAPAEIDAVIAELVALKQEMDPPVITDSERTCQQVNPDGSGEHCTRGGDHGVCKDSNGDEWRTDLAVSAVTA